MVFLDTPLHVDADRRKQTPLAQIPEGTVVQNQPSLQTSHLIVSIFGQHEGFNRTYGKSMYMDNQLLIIMFAIVVIPAECGTRILNSVTSVNM